MGTCPTCNRAGLPGSPCGCGSFFQITHQGQVPVPSPSISHMTSTITPPDAGGAVTFAGSSVTSYRAPTSRRPSSVTTPSIQQSVTHEDLEAAVDRRLLLQVLARPEKVPVVTLKISNGQQAK